MDSTQTALARPFPPEHWDIEAPAADFASFLPADDVHRWVESTFLAKDGPLHNPDHQHLLLATIGFLWTDARNSRRGRIVQGQAELAVPTGSMSAWMKAARLHQLRQWFGIIPRFLITLSAPECWLMDDATFCALVEHELYHCAQSVDEWGNKRWTRDGDPIFTIRGHDIEQFLPVIERYGVGVDPEAQALVELAQRGPTIAKAKISLACGTCSR
jgi:hypothetical protein